MALNAERVGHRYPSYRYEVSREKVREYARATGVTDPRALADEGPLAVPPTFAACFTVGPVVDLTRDPELGGHAGVLHASQEYDFHRPLAVGDALQCTPEIAGLVRRGATDFLSVTVDCRDEATGEPVVTARARLVFGDAPPPTAAAPAPDGV